jgi:hypothetical protein
MEIKKDISSEINKEIGLKLEQLACDQAHALLTSALSTGDLDIVSNNLHVLKRTAIHLLSSMLYNRVINHCEGKLDPSFLQAEISSISDDLRNCVQWNKMKVEQGVFEHHDFKSDK